MKSEPGIGDVIAGYRIDGLLGRGGMGVVYLAEDVTLGRKAVVKLLAPELSESENFRKRFVRESHLAAAIDHPNVLPIYQAGEFNGLLYIAMRFVEGDDLRGLLLREGSLDPERSLSIITQVARALNAAHARGLVHRDVKPANILITVEAEEAEHVYLTDFGLTKQTSSDSGLTGIGTFVGTIDYVSPEQIQGLPLDGRADIYALGCVFFECLTGQVPFRKDGEVAVMFAHLSEPPPSLLDFREDLPAGLDVVIARAMAKSREDRYPTALAMAAEALMQAQSRVGVTLENEKAPPLQAPPSQAVMGDDVVDLTLIDSASEVERRKEQEEAKSRTGEEARQEEAVREAAKPAGDGAEEVTRIASRSEVPSAQQSVAMGAPESAPGGARAAELTDSMQAPQPESGMAESPSLAPPAEPAPQGEPSPREGKRKRSRSRSLAIAVVGALVLAGGVGVFLVLPRGSPTSPPSPSPSTPPPSLPSSSSPGVIRLTPVSLTGNGMVGGVQMNAVAYLSSGLVAVGSDASAGTDSAAAVWTSADNGRSWTRTPSSNCRLCAEAGSALQMNDVVGPSLVAASSGPVAVGSVTHPDHSTGAAVWTQDQSTGVWARVPDGNCQQCDGTGDQQMSSVAAVGPSLVAVGGSTVIVGGRRSSAAAVWRSTDGGQSWTRIAPDDVVFHGASLKMVSITSTSVEAKAVAVGYGDKGAAVWDSSDGGSTWTRVPTKRCQGCRGKGHNMFGVTAIGSTLVAVGNNEFVSQQGGGATDVDGAIWVSSDGGLSWRRVSPKTPSFLGAGVEIRAVIPAGDGLLAVGKDDNGGAVWTSPGATSTWTRLTKKQCVSCSGQVFMNDLVAIGNGFVIAGYMTDNGKDRVAAWVGSNGASPTP
jgi:serine/threonine protein kinase/photosystem II stability/assembly factor-like uncharacterized protein